MEFRKMLKTLYAEQKKRHRFIEQSFRLCGRRRGWDVSREQLGHMYTIKGETDYWPRLDAWDKCSDLVLWEDLEGAGGEGGGRGDRDGEDMWTQGLFISKYDKIHYKKKKEKKRNRWFLDERPWHPAPTFPRCSLKPACLSRWGVSSDKA